MHSVLVTPRIDKPRVIPVNSLEHKNPEISSFLKCAGVSHSEDVANMAEPMISIGNTEVSILEESVGCATEDESCTATSDDGAVVISAAFSVGLAVWTAELGSSVTTTGGISVVGLAVVIVDFVGFLVDESVGFCVVGFAVGEMVENFVGNSVGFCVVAFAVGEIVGDLVGDTVGF